MKKRRATRAPCNSCLFRYRCELKIIGFCPCLICLVKMVCNRICPDANLYFLNLDPDEEAWCEKGDT